ncbi:unnamed protein product [Rotaria socialis]|uniref:Uncharacterized protein n=1 Tax=Rotaria socialis TaxID=392032 RepID=A0A820RVC2_9BILA|nr:unnamed protein product [Rotaria socialis]CAF3312853.1 unnamed protein product [Rotaria socialis]CAF3361320.1 unnamed protein product [Rotaria socialis]CAF3467366.1 unnamed protein product [Rotaria socialis]CAF3546731.1 unnamed protein product [Rotaria socialis]
MSDEDEDQLNSNITSHNTVDVRRRLLEIKNDLQGLMRQKKKYDEEKLKQDSEFLQTEINALRTSISDINKEINNQTQTKKRLHVQMTNLRSRSRLRYTNLAIALRDKRRYEAELKKENKTDEYRALAQREIRSIETALPVLQEEDEYKAQLKTAEDAQQAATIKRKKLEESLNKNLRKQTDIKQLLSENAEKLPQIEATIESLRCERESLLSSATNAHSTNGKKCRRRLHSNQQKSLDSPTAAAAAQTPIRACVSFENDCLEHEKNQCDDQLNKINTLISYFRDKLTEHDLSNDHTCVTPSSELTSLLYHPLTPHEEQTILSSYMEDRDCDNILLSKSTTTQPTAAIAMKLPRNFLPLNLNSASTNEIIHSPYYAGNEIEYKKELSSDIVNKYGGHPKKNKQQLSSNIGKKNKKHKKNFAITHIPQMIALYNTVHGSTGSYDTLPSMPMYEYELVPTIQSLEFLQQSLESYLNELSRRYENNVKSSNNDEDEGQNKSGIDNEDDDIRDSALDTFSETSSLIEPMNIAKQLASPNSTLMNILEVRSSASSDDKKTINSSSSPPSSNHSDSKKNKQLTLNSSSTKLEELSSHLQDIQIDRQISDEGYRSVRNDQQQATGVASNHCLPLLTRSQSYDSTEKVDQWLSTATPLTSSVPMSISFNTNFQPTDIDDEE